MKLSAGAFRFLVSSQAKLHNVRNKLLNFRGMCISFLGRLMWFLISSFIFRGLLDEELDFVPPTQPGVLSCP